MWLRIMIRVASAFATLAIVSLLIFYCTQLLPGDTAEALLGQNATPESLAALRAQMGLDQPAMLRYLHWISGLLQGNLGTAIGSGVPVASLIWEPLINSLKLACLTAAISIPLALGLGLLSVLRLGSAYDRGVTFGALCAVSMPEFFLATLLTYLFAVQLGWLPATAIMRPHQSAVQQLRSMILPTAVLTLVVTAHMARMTRSAVLSVLTLPYIETALLKGVRRREIILRHALPNVVAPIVSVIAVVMAYLIAGVVVVEVAFAYPGLGRLMVDSVAIRDIPLIQACGLIFCAVYLLINLTADIVTAVANPRLRETNRAQS